MREGDARWGEIDARERKGRARRGFFLAVREPLPLPAPSRALAPLRFLPARHEACQHAPHQRRGALQLWVTWDPRSRRRALQTRRCGPVAELAMRGRALGEGRSRKNRRRTRCRRGLEGTACSLVRPQRQAQRGGREPSQRYEQRLLIF